MSTLRKGSQELLKEFQKELPQEYQHLNYEQLREICYSPWKMLKDEMEQGTLVPVRFQYFGTFQVYEGRAKNMLKRLQKRYEENTINHQEYFRLKKMLENYLDGKDKSK